MASPRILIIGAGPAGVRCAETLVNAGLRPCVIDESVASGGQIYRRQPPGFQRSYSQLYGTEAHKAQDLHSSFDQLLHAIDYYPGTSVWNIQDQTVYAYQDDQPLEFTFDAVILCTGAIDRVLPIKGWQHAGTYSLGGAQTALKHQAVSIGKQVVFVGTGPLLYLVASQYVKAGANVVAVLDTSTLRNRFKALPKLLMKPMALYHGMLMMGKLFAKRVRMVSGVTPQEIIGTPATGVSALSYSYRDLKHDRSRDHNNDHNKQGQVDEIPCDAVALGYHLRPESQLADLAGCQFEFDPLSDAWIPTTDASGRTSQAGVYTAGDGAKIKGADAAECAGRLAALAVLGDLQSLTPLQITQQQQLLVQMKQLSDFAAGLHTAFPWPREHINALDDDTIVCRCEMITAGELRASVTHCGAEEVNRAKSFSRVGMGRCQGRFCAHVGAQIIQAATGNTGSQSGRQRSQAPVKPLPIDLYLKAPKTITPSSTENKRTEDAG